MDAGFVIPLHLIDLPSDADGLISRKLIEAAYARGRL